MTMVTWMMMIATKINPQLRRHQKKVNLLLMALLVVVKH